MSKQKPVKVPDNAFGIKDKNPIERLASPPQPVRIAESEPAAPTEKLEKMSIYVTAEQKAKLDDLAKEHRKQTGESTGRIDVVRMLIERASIDSLL